MQESYRLPEPAVKPRCGAVALWRCGECIQTTEVMPPSTKMFCPETKFEASAQR